MNQGENKTLTLLEKMKLKAQAQKEERPVYENKAANMNVNTCPNCGAGRAKQDGITKCGYCGFNFMDIIITKGININEDSNSQ